MPRKLDLTEFASGSEHKATHLARSTSGAFAAAISVLLIATLVIDRSTTAVAGDQAVSLALTNTQIDVRATADGQASHRCIDVGPTRGDRIVDIVVNATVDGFVDPGLEIAIVSGDSSISGSCDQFAPHQTMFDGTLQELTRAPLVLGHGHSAQSLMFVIQERSGAPDGNSNAVIHFSWEVNPA
jgi:hypothetical protein